MVVNRCPPAARGRRASFFLRVLIASVLLALPVQASSGAPPRHWFSLNPVKPFQGAAHLEYELTVLRHLSVRAAGEYRLVHDARRPDWSGQVGLRWWFAPAFGVQSGLFSGLQTGLAEAREHRAVGTGPFVGVDAGFRHLISPNLFLLPKVTIDFGLETRDVRPGLEVMLGACF